MSRYIIKVTYLEGRHKGDVYYMGKGGYVVDLDQYFCDFNSYATEAIAKSVCTRYKRSNDLSRDIERRQEEYDISKGKEPKSFYIYHYESYEPFEVED